MTGKLTAGDFPNYWMGTSTTNGINYDATISDSLILPSEEIKLILAMAETLKLILKRSFTGREVAEQGEELSIQVDIVKNKYELGGMSEQEKLIRVKEYIEKNPDLLYVLEGRDKRSNKK